MPFEKLFSKIWNTNYLYVILIIGVAVMLLCAGGNKKKEETPSKITAYTPSEEEKLEKILSQIDGVGEASVMITYFASSEKSLAYEKKTDRRGETSQGYGGESSDEKAVLSDGEPVIVREIYPEVKGVVVIAEGAEIPSVKQAICEAVSTSLGTGMHRICVLPKSD